MTVAYVCPDWSPMLPFCGSCRRTIREDHEPSCPFDEPPPDPPGGERGERFPIELAG